MQDRYLKELIQEMALDCNKIAFLSGPRQCGKTTFAKQLLAECGNGRYYNWDQPTFRRMWSEDPSRVIDGLDRAPSPIVILDEIHKARYWKRNLKGVFDTLSHPVNFLVTGSARLDTYQRGSDSLLGRYFGFRLHPFSLREMQGLAPSTPKQLMDLVKAGEFPLRRDAADYLLNLERFGGFPEPLFAQSDRRARLWRTTRKNLLIREDLRDLSRIVELSQVEMLVSLLPNYAAKQLSRANLAADLEVAFNTIKRWLLYLEAIYYFFEIKPYAGRIKRSLKKEGKFYYWDFAEAEDPGARFENMIAAHLLKACHFWTDSGEGDFELRYLRDKSGNEIDFLILKDKKPWLPVEAKRSELSPAPAWKAFFPQLPCKIGIQVVLEPKIDRVSQVADGRVHVISAANFLSTLV